MPQVRDAIGLVEKQGWILVRVKGSHRIYRHPSKQGAVVIAGHPSKHLATGTWNSILKQAGLK